MKEKLLQGITFFGAALLLTASFAIIFWIGQSEESRLALRQQFSLEKVAQLRSQREMESTQEEPSSTDDLSQAFSKIDTLLSSVGSDDLPVEE